MITCSQCGHTVYNSYSWSTPLNEVVACTLHEGGHWIPYPRWIREYSDKMPAAEMWANGAIYDYVLEALGRDPERCWYMCHH